MKNKKTLAESMEDFPFQKYGDYIRLIFNLNYFLKNATQIVNDFNTYGACVIQDDDKAYGLMFKDNSGDDNDIYMKAHVYRWPQSGVINGGVTFFTGSKNFAEELQKALPKVR